MYSLSTHLPQGISTGGNEVGSSSGSHTFEEERLMFLSYPNGSFLHRMQLLLLPDEHTITIVVATAAGDILYHYLLLGETLILCVSGALALVAACTISSLNFIFSSLTF